MRFMAVALCSARSAITLTLEPTRIATDAPGAGVSLA